MAAGGMTTGQTPQKECKNIKTGQVRRGRHKNKRRKLQGAKVNNPPAEFRVSATIETDLLI
jgi:hypothetical protein